jgi:hypothetical protein
MPGGHFDTSVEAFDLPASASVDWFTQHLIQRAGVPA